jgi:predicted phage tail component-like protein
MNYGLSFKGLKSSAFGVSVKSDNRQVLSDVVRQTKFVPGLGMVDFGNDTYNEKVMTVTMQYNYHNDSALLALQVEQVGGWLYNDGLYYDLIFDDQPNRKYKAKCVGKIDLAQGNSLGTLSVEFTCNPPYPCALDNSPVSPADVQGRLLWDTMKLDGIQYLQDLSANDTIKFTVGGNLSVKPVIKLIGNIASGLTLTYGAYSWKYNAALLFDGIIIDCVAQTVTRMSDGANLFPNVDATYDDYFNLAIGQQSIAVVGVVGAFPNDLTIAVEFTPQYS